MNTMDELNQLFAYLIVCNNYIHNEQIRLLKKISAKNKSGNLPGDIKSILDGKAQSVEFSHITEKLKKESPDTIKKLCKKLIQVACYDGKYDQIEDELINRVYNEIMITGTPFDKQKYIKRYLLFFKLRTHRFSPENMLRLMCHRFSFNIKLSDFLPDSHFSHDIAIELEESAKIEYKQDRKDNRKHLLDTTANNVREIVNQYLQESEAYNNNDVTVALVGRTCAGKSTLFSVLSRSGEDFIGLGGQRTTRYLRACHVDGIRIIDTPGLNSAAKEGRIDEKIALQSLKGADLVVFVTTDDTQEKQVKAFMGDIVKSEIPIICIINTYIMPEELDKEYNWANIEYIEGVKNNIERFAEANGWNGKIKYLAAVFKQAQKSDKRIWTGKNVNFFKRYKLRKYSRINQLVQEIGQELILYSIYYRKIRRFNYAINTANEIEIELKKTLELLKKEKELCSDKITEIRNKINEIRTDYKEEISSLVENRMNYSVLESIVKENKAKSKLIEESFKTLIEDLNSEIQTLYMNYAEDVCSAVSQIFEGTKRYSGYVSDLAIDISLDKMKFIEWFPLKEAVSTLKSAAGSVMSWMGIPGGWIVETADSLIPKEKWIGPNFVERKRNRDQKTIAQLEQITNDYKSKTIMQFTKEADVLSQKLLKYPNKIRIWCEEDIESTMNAIEEIENKKRSYEQRKRENK